MTSSPIYKKPDAAQIKAKLTPQQFACTQLDDTEKPFENAYWAHKEPGIYVDVVTGEPLFSSQHKYDSGSGWPSFTEPIHSQALAAKTDLKLSVPRTEVRSKLGDSHLGHVFEDGPQDRGGKRYCINSASLRFVPLAQMQKEGYGRYLFSFASEQKWQIATLAGGCFWGVEELFRKEVGVIETQVGYIGGKIQQPTYEDVKKGTSGHAEAIQVLFDPKKISYQQLLELYFKLHDPTTLHRQGNDVGSQYRSAIFFHSPEQQAQAQQMKDKVAKSGAWQKPIVTELIAAPMFYRAEEYHQKYLQKNPGGYTCHFIRDLKF